MWYRIIAAILRPIFFLLHPYKIVGKENIPGTGRHILCCNHQSGWDPVLLIVGQRRKIAFMAKAELFRTPLQRGFFGKIFGAFPVERGKGDTGALDKAEGLIASGRMVGIFPEGSRFKDGVIHRFKSGLALIAAKSGAAVVPCAFNERSRLFHRVTVRFGKPLSPEELHLTGDKPELRYATRLLRERVAQLAGQELAESAEQELAG